MTVAVQLGCAWQLSAKITWRALAAGHAWEGKRKTPKPCFETARTEIK